MLRKLYAFLLVALLGVGCFMPRASFANTERYRVDRELRNGDYYALRIPAEEVREVEVVLRRIDPRASDTQVKVGFDDGTVIGASQQVDKERFHSLRFSGNDINSRGRDLRINVQNGRVYVKEVIVDSKEERRYSRYDDRSYRERDIRDRERYSYDYDRGRDPHFGSDWRERNPRWREPSRW